MQQEVATTRQTSKTCFDEIREKPQYAELKRKLYYADDSVNVPLQYLTNPARPSKKDLGDVFALHADIQGCRKVLVDGQAKIHPLIVTTQVEGFTAADRIWTEFAAGKMSWGEFNTKRKDVAVDVQQRMVAASQRIDAQLTNNHRYEVEQRQRAAEAVSAWAAQQQAIAAMNRPRTTNCTGFGNSINCTTY